MRYAYYDLGEQQEGNTVTVRLRGSAANVILLDAANFSSYHHRLPFFYHAGGLSLRSPVEFAIPDDGHWYVVVDLGGYKGRSRATVTVRPRDPMSERSQDAEAVHGAVGSR